jgi:hypothetical protein
VVVRKLTEEERKARARALDEAKAANPHRRCVMACRPRMLAVRRAGPAGIRKKAPPCVWSGAKVSLMLSLMGYPCAPPKRETRGEALRGLMSIERPHGSGMEVCLRHFPDRRCGGSPERR